MVVIIVGLRTAGQTLNTLTTSLERLCAKEERTWKERIFNQMRLVSFLLRVFDQKHLIRKETRRKTHFFFLRSDIFVDCLTYIA